MGDMKKKSSSAILVEYFCRLALKNGGKIGGSCDLGGREVILFH